MFDLRRRDLFCVFYVECEFSEEAVRVKLYLRISRYKSWCIVSDPIPPLSEQFLQVFVGGGEIHFQKPLHSTRIT